MSVRGTAGVVGGYATGAAVTAWRPGMPLIYLMIPPAAMLVVVFLTELPNILDAMTRRYQAVTDRKAKLEHCHSCDASSSPENEEQWWRRWRLPWGRRRGEPPSTSS